MTKVRKCKTGNGKAEYQHSDYIWNETQNQLGCYNQRSQSVEEIKRNERWAGLILDKEEVCWPTGNSQACWLEKQKATGAITDAVLEL